MCISHCIWMEIGNVGSPVHQKVYTDDALGVRCSVLGNEFSLIENLVHVHT